jgi:hypothetical protein
MDNYFTIHAGLKNCPLFFKIVAKFQGVDYVSIVGNRKGLTPVGNQKWLAVDHIGVTGGGIADMTHSKVTGELLEIIFIKNLGNKPHILVEGNFTAIAGHYPRTFLTPVLECIKAEIGQFSSFFMTINTADAAFMGRFADRISVRGIFVF